MQCKNRLPELWISKWFQQEHQVWAHNGLKERWCTPWYAPHRPYPAITSRENLSCMHRNIINVHMSASAITRTFSLTTNNSRQKSASALHWGATRDFWSKKTKTSMFILRGYKLVIMWKASINALWLTVLKCAQIHKRGCFQLVHWEREHSGKEMSYFPSAVPGKWLSHA